MRKEKNTIRIKRKKKRKKNNMKKIKIISILSFILISFANAEIKDCSEFDKLSKMYLKCTKDNLKHKSDKSGLTKKLDNFKSSKTLTEFFKKNKGEE